MPVGLRYCVIVLFHPEVLFTFNKLTFLQETLDFLVTPLFNWPESFFHSWILFPACVFLVIEEPPSLFSVLSVLCLILSWQRTSTYAAC
jgi:hypothetical protein